MTREIIVACLFLSTQVDAQSHTDSLSRKQFQRELHVTAKGQYLLYLPREYALDAAKRWPLVLFLHGSGERGSDPELVKRHGPTRMIAEGDQFDFILVAPQCPENETWSTQMLQGVLDDVGEEHRVDSNRIYLTGLSLGGWGVWNLAMAFPERFAAIAPVCGIADKYMVERVCRLKDVPTWVFHGAKDDIVPLSDSEQMVNALRECGGNVRLTVYPEANHNAWDETYCNPYFFIWLLEQHK